MNDQSTQIEPTDPRVAAALRDYLDRVDRGEPFDHNVFLAQHAEIADLLRPYLGVADEVRQAAGDAQNTADGSATIRVEHERETLPPPASAERSVVPAGPGLARQFGRYRIIEIVGQGAMGTVHLAEDTQLGRRVALKSPRFDEDPTGELRERFYREARSAATLRHPNICPVYDVGQIEAKHYISMAYIEGRPLADLIQPDKPLPERQILNVIRKLAQALQEAHDHGIIHRDLKPANIMIEQRGEPIIMDFGLARQVRREEGSCLTQHGVLMGSPAYMSPEQVEGESARVGPATDQYSLGVILYELLTGELPFRGSLAAVLGQIVSREPTPPSRIRAGIDPRVEAICLKMMAKGPADRFASLKAVADELTKVLRSPNATLTPAEEAASSEAILPVVRLPASNSVLSRSPSEYCLWPMTFE